MAVVQREVERDAAGLHLSRHILDTQELFEPCGRSNAQPVYAARALKVGAKGYVSKNASPEELRTAFQRVSQGLTYVEGEIAQHLAATQPERVRSVASGHLADGDERFCGNQELRVGPKADAASVELENGSCPSASTLRPDAQTRSSAGA